MKQSEASAPNLFTTMNTFVRSYRRQNYFDQRVKNLKQEIFSCNKNFIHNNIPKCSYNIGQCLNSGKIESKGGTIGGTVLAVEGRGGERKKGE